MSDILKVIILFPFLIPVVRAVDIYLQRRQTGKQELDDEEEEKIPVRAHRRMVKGYLRSKPKRKKPKKNSWWK